MPHYTFYQIKMDRRDFIASATALTLSSTLFAKSIWNHSTPIKIGIIGLDSTHALAFTRAINKGGNSLYDGFKVVAAYPYGSKTIPLSKERIPKFSEEIQQYEVKLVESISILLEQVDCVLLETNDGNLHLEQALEVIKAKKTLFIDKPISNSYSDAFKIFQAAKENHVPVFSSSALRFIDGISDFDRAKLIGASVYCPAPTEPTHKDLYWYGIHGVEMLFRIMGPDCINVRSFDGIDSTIYIGTWKGGKQASLHGMRKEFEDFGGSIFLENGKKELGKFTGYEVLLEQILKFFKTGISPVPEEETLAICAFIDAAAISKRKGGKEIKLRVQK